jgi:uncharacterized membrane protein (UPF0127 family)
VKFAVEFTRVLAQPVAMKRLCFALTLLALLAGGPGCGKSEPPAGDVFALALPQQAQPRLPTLTLWLDNQRLTAEIARQPMEVMTGMMFRTNMPDREGMIFVFNDAERRSFWMKNTLVPLSLAYIDPDGVVREIHDLQPLNTNSAPSDSRLIQYVLEVNQGWFRTNGIRPGAVVRTEKGGLKETFFPFR